MYGLMKSGLCTLAAAALLTAPAGAQTRLDREGTVGLSAFGDFATLTGQSRLGLDFKSGGGYGIDIRYTLNPHWSLGLAFHNQTYGAVRGAKSIGAEVDKLVSTEVTAEAYYYRDRNVDAAQYAVLGVGFYRPEVHRTDEDILFPGENLFVTAGLGVEVFLRENWGIDLSARGIGLPGRRHRRPGAGSDGRIGSGDRRRGASRWAFRCRPGSSTTSRVEAGTRHVGEARLSGRGQGPPRRFRRGSRGGDSRPSLLRHPRSRLLLGREAVEQHPPSIAPQAPG